MTNKIVALTTCESREDAFRIATALVEKKCAACVNILPGVTSVYRWKGNVEQAGEWLLMIKTTAEQFENLKEAVREIHPYEVPELIGLNIAGGAPGYLEWIEAQCMM